MGLVLPYLKIANTEARGSWGGEGSRVRYAFTTVGLSRGKSNGLLQI